MIKKIIAGHAMALASPKSWGFSTRIAVSFVALLSASSSSLAQINESHNLRGYRDCNLDHLEACANTNQMFVGVRGTNLFNTYNKPELPAAIERFLRGAPTIQDFGHSFSASEVATEALWGAGSRFQFPGGEWFFTGFTPHDAVDQAAIIFDASGHILLLATLETDMSLPPKGAYGGYHQNVTIYLHSPEPEAKFVERTVRWARDSVSDRNSSFPDLPKDEIGTIRILTASTDQRQWNSHVLE